MFQNPFATAAYNDPYEALSYYERTQSAHSAPRAFPTHPAVRRPQTLYTRKLAPQLSDFQTSQPVDYWRSTVMLSQTTHDWRRIGYSNVPDLSRQYENFSSPFSPQASRQPSFEVDFAYQPSSALNFNSADTQDGLDEDRWCCNPKEEDLSNRNHDLSFSSYDGMSSTFGAFELTPPMRWQEDTAPGGTISPKVLSLSSLFSSSAASPCHDHDLEKPSEMHELSLHCPDDNISHYHGPKYLAEPETHQSSTRHKLPSKPIRQQYVPILPSTDAKGTKKRASITRQTMVRRSPSHSSPPHLTPPGLPSRTRQVLHHPAHQQTQTCPASAHRPQRRVPDRVQAGGDVVPGDPAGGGVQGGGEHAAGTLPDADEEQGGEGAEAGVAGGGREVVAQGGGEVWEVWGEEGAGGGEGEDPVEEGRRVYCGAWRQLSLWECDV